MSTPPAHRLLRHRGSHDAGKVGMVELFFDLVFVFAVTQLSHGLLGALTPLGALRMSMLLLSVWGAWMATSWVTNWLDPERIPVRLLLFALMGAGLVLGAAIPEAFGTSGLAFALAFQLMQLGRTLFMVGVLRHGPQRRLRNFQRVLVWYLVETPLWILGGLADPQDRALLWAAAIGMQLVGPWVYYWVPGLGRSSTADWDVDGAHMAERCALFVIIALGESLLITGATFSELSPSPPTIGAFVAAFLGAVAMWWIYFHAGAEHGSRRIATSDDPGRTARIAYTYLHIPLVAGIIVSAAGNELMLLHPEAAHAAEAAVVLGGPALFLLGVASFKWVNYDRRNPPLSHLIGLLLLGGLAGAAARVALSPGQLGLGAALALLVVALWESVALTRPPRAPAPTA